MQCELLGTAETEHVKALIALLTGLSGRSGTPIHRLELKIKSQVAPFTELKLLQQTTSGDTAYLDRYRLELVAIQHTVSYTAGHVALAAHYHDGCCCSWEICHEGIPVRGKGYAELPALVRSHTRASLHGAHSLSFWTHLGFSVSYELEVKGSCFLVCHDAHELQVLNTC